MAFLIKVVVFLFLLFLTNVGDAFASDDLVFNGDFDDGLNYWIKNVSTLTAVATQSAALLSGTTSSTKYLYQMVAATGSTTYKFSGRARLLSGSASAYLRVTEDNNSSHDSTHSANLDWTDLSVIFTTTTNTASLKLKINLDPNFASPSALYWDSISLVRVLPLTINYSLPASVSAGTAFSVPIEIINASPQTKYFFKGESDGSVYSFNDPFWLAENGSWVSMPSLVTDSFGSGSAILQTKFNSLASNFFIRLRQEGIEINIDSPPSLIMVNPAPVAQLSLPFKIDLSSPSSISADISQNILINLNNASPSATYFLKIIGGVSTASADLQSVSTFNTSWLAWNGSWADMPTISTNDSGSGSANIPFRFNSSSTSPGLNFLIARLRLINDSENIDSLPVSIFIDVPQSTQISNSLPSFDFSLPTTASVGGQLEISLKISNLFSNITYYLKSRLGPDSTHLTHGQTFNNQWLSDNDAWTNFPKITADSNGKWEGKIIARLNDNQTPGQYFAQIRLRRVGYDTNYDSNLKNINFVNNEAEIPEVTIEVINGILGVATESAIIDSPEKIIPPININIPEKIVISAENLQLTGDKLISWGMTFLGAAFSGVFLRKREFGV